MFPSLPRKGLGEVLEIGSLLSLVFLNYMTLSVISKKISTCKECLLHKTRTNTVSGEGSEKAEVIFVGEGPGQSEDLAGRPFCGAAGKYLDELLQKTGFKRKEVFIGNIVKCRPPGNRDPLPVEIDACTPYLDQQIEVINPKLIVTLGRFSMNHFLPKCGISRDHGKVFKKGNRLYFPIFHPAAALYRGQLKEMIEADFAKIPKILKDFDKIMENKKEAEDKNEDIEDKNKKSSDDQSAMMRDLEDKPIQSQMNLGL